MATTVVDPNKPLDGPSVTLTIRLIMQGKEVGSIIGKKGDNIKKFREESGAKINISDGSCPERIVTVTGSTESILKAFSLIGRKFEELHEPWKDGQSGTNPVTLRLIVPASQCGSLIGKGGAKIKEIREITGATIQVASEMLPNSTERAVTISGNSDSITKCIYQICCVLMESPAKGATIPYRPKPAMPPVIFAGGQAYTLQGQYAIPHPDLTKLHQLALQHAPLLPGHNVNTVNPQALATLTATSSIRPVAATTLATTGAATTEMAIPNDLIGCIIGKGGAKINEIRQLSGAAIKISNSEEGSKDRTVSITGTPESINLAQYLINTSMELHQNLTLDPSSNPTSNAATTLTINPLAIPLTQLVKPSPLALAVNPNAANLFDLNNFSSQTSRMKPMKLKAGTQGMTTTPGIETKADRKFAPY
ncbi:poly(rC)-binding protein 3-like isoform X1 [Panonychus citri]|uniref:poly(rC)-binding protein 3-like isoform X1 n=1 Tax=Panonychus citri TaxID=50023 RepID=UPI002306E72D|nr:poly(rC)-binding protein 3-like isoform X1 [Panonychus citri]XP_053204138.1 poly(rC)-binding protein 3-like isoform X1 [Panonychus citri]XP_053204139.1 poly(rC)-binding protein 3-like isoform X1 [Panonychus citri]XP_053204140.1 poly(rC)-binding protein 3-like isoform X1 [Panonychus citri]